ncbi:MAG: hypothetical protein HDT30_09455 [Clostridiales bacterium]|nr:hypothetical protein [Clostridiales bacterium]
MKIKRSNYLRYGYNPPESEGKIQSKKVKKYNVEKLIQNLTEPYIWKDHIENDLMKFWKKDALELQGGLFPTYLTNEGFRLSENPDEWTEEFKAALKDDDTKGLVTPEYNYVRAHSRLTYANGIAYHVTGKENYLKQCKKGTEALINAMDGNYGMYTMQEKSSGKWGMAREERTSQDLAYGLTGLGMYYFLTHDETVLHHIIKYKNYIFDTYFDKGKGYFTWFPKDNMDNSVEIVAQLDQIYAYMLFLTPSLPEPYQSEWKKDLKGIVDILIWRFYSERYEFFWGQDTTSGVHKLGSDHTDFGHSVKTMWLIMRVGVLLKDISYVIFAREKIDRILKEAYIAKDKCWGRRFDKEGKMDKNKEWWILAELDQAAAILALNDPSYLQYLNHTYAYWFQYMVDHENGEIWHMVDGDTNQPVLNYPKAHSWKTSLHSFEHALFGYMTSSQIKGEEFDLYYAFSKEVDVQNAVPYIFQANKILGQFFQELSFMEDKNRIVKVTYNALR